MSVFACDNTSPEQKFTLQRHRSPTLSDIRHDHEKIHPATRERHRRSTKQHHPSSVRRRPTSGNMFIKNTQHQTSHGVFKMQTNNV